MEILADILFDLYLNYAKRALLGGGKGQFIMAQLRQDNEELYHQVMRKAKDELLVANPIRLEIARDNHRQLPILMEDS